jgi:hypothetical protein
MYANVRLFKQETEMMYSVILKEGLVPETLKLLIYYFEVFGFLIFINEDFLGLAFDIYNGCPKKKYSGLIYNNF